MPSEERSVGVSASPCESGDGHPLLLINGIGAHMAMRTAPGARVNRYAVDRLRLAGDEPVADPLLPLSLESLAI